MTGLILVIAAMLLPVLAAHRLCRPYDHGH